MPDFNSVEEVLEELPSGSMVVLVDERGQDVDGTELVGEGELVTLAETVTPQTINFMAQQAGEKSVKGYLYARGSEDVWGNSLADLCEDAKYFEMLFDVLKSRAIFLDKYYELTRYPDFLPGGIPSDAFDVLEAERAIELAEEVVQFVKERMQEIDG